MTHGLRIAFVVTALVGAARAQDYLMIPDSTADKITLYSPADGSLVNANFILDAGGVPFDFSTPKDAIQVGGEIWVFDQISDQIIRFDTAGAHIATILPAVGMVDNMRGACYANNTIYVSDDGAGNGAIADTAVMFDIAGNRIGAFSTLGSGTGPFDVTEFNGELLIPHFTSTNVIGRYDYFGNYLGAFHSSAGATDVDLPEQISLGSNNTVIVAGFGAPIGIYRYDSAGALVNTYAVGTGNRGCYELDNGQILFTDGGGVKVHDPLGNTTVTITSGTGFQFVNRLSLSPQPTVYCTAGLSSSGCVPAISASGTPSAGAASGFTLSAFNIEGQKQGLLFYGLSGQAAAPWGTTTSFLCMKAPTQRMSAQNSGGIAGGCNGSLSEDWLAFIAAHPTALGAPFSSGTVIDAQGWYRDPPNSKTTSLTDAIEFTLVP